MKIVFECSININKMHKARFGLIFLISSIISVSFGLLMYTEKEVSAIPQGCRDFVIIFARGSGQALDNQPERDSLYSSLGKYVDLNKDNFIDLDSSFMPNDLGLNYRAQKVMGDLDGLGAGMFAVISRSNFGSYSQSVKDGKDLVVNYIQNSNFLECGTRMVLAGYSQGAQVIGEAVSDLRLVNYLPQISFVATFGDPSLDINTLLGGDIFADTTWYRGNATKYISGGLVNVRNPYLPQAMQDKAGAWCEETDVICTGNVLKLLNEVVNKPHSSYPQKAIPEAAKEIAYRLKKDLAVPFSGPQCGAIKQDIVLAVNLSAAVRGDVGFLSDNGIKKTVEGAFNTGCDVRVGMVAFGNTGVDMTRPVLDFTTNKSDLTSVLSSFKENPATSTMIQKADVIGGISTALDFSWRSDAQKSIIVLSDAPGDNYRMKSGLLDRDQLMQSPEMQDIIKKSRDKGAVEINASQIVHASWQPYQYTLGSVSFYNYIDQLVKVTAGTFTTRGNCDWCFWGDVRFDFKNQLAKKPTVSVPNIRIKQGQSIELTARDISGGVIAEQGAQPNSPVTYTWFTDCQKLASSTYYGAKITFHASAVGNCNGGVLVRGNSWAYCNICYEGDPYGARALTPFSIEVLPADYVDPPTPGVVRNITKERLWNDDALRVSWDPPANAFEAGELAYVIKDADGNILGATRSTNLNITDVSDIDKPIVLVSAVSATSAGATVSTQDAQDVSQPKPSQAVTQTGQNYGVTTEQAVAAPGNVSGVIALQASRINSQILGVEIATPIFHPSSTVDVISKQTNNNSIWTTISILAMPIIAAVALGFVVKYGMLLRFDKK